MLTFSYQLEDIDLAADRVIEAAGDEKIWVFKGQMGAGKTTLIKALSRKLGVMESVSSPTFGIVNEYHTETGDKVFHFDFYRMEDPMEALDIGIEEYFYSGKFCWLEWAENIAQFLPDHFFLIKIEANSVSGRTITLQHSQDAY
ncbi:tRNA (adenosine(37)-N6)-threonylcarbamoyltransferase complex ATPase subunit type 1 TsaE [Algoriphagus sp. AK58]|uniref:tRNA (adenosine(37)-N6)-threonylcarbamoyltransferase complex ATPase subunit type 1 TsaE n=1 Tax=Algoriphagus sp. AK58 TaxID=1406877 RepID=UPI00164FA00C|nr:tRNA (adenosine(37)-N6)-threonylcarbamoyltransferase complex ATPase subunit type 1 TsaE [Algoriphagus sp. AK58]MBC6368977.1 tRNA (adenosine(37)-N6)-threonylcarbamoyltransferase complex ATPase subunit type 1 TsaE [Algoriphagus sp. AK58]